MLKAMIEAEKGTSVEKREKIANALKNKELTMNDIQEASLNADSKTLALLLEAMEEVTQKNPEAATLDWLLFAQTYIDADANSLKRESARIVGNIAHLFEKDLDTAISKLLRNTKNDGTVVRWSSAYALARIILIPRFADSELFNQLTELSDAEEESGVRNQYRKALKKALRFRK